jgi:DNA-binding IclR family transcriptional regulator
MVVSFRYVVMMRLIRSGQARAGRIDVKQDADPIAQDGGAQDPIAQDPIAQDPGTLGGGARDSRAPDGDGHDGGSVLVIQKSARILDCLAGAAGPLRASEIRELTGLPMTTVARLLRTLLAEDLLAREGPYYSIGLRVTGWAHAASAGSDLIASAEPLISQLRDSSGETAGLYVSQGTNRVCVLLKESGQPIAYRSMPGQVRPMHGGAAGRIFMAFDPSARQAVLDAGLTAHTSKTITDPEVLEARLEQVRRQGWAFVAGERELGLNTVAAPIVDPAGRLVAAVAISGPSFRMARPQAGRLAGLVTGCAEQISLAIAKGAA